MARKHGKDGKHARNHGKGSSAASLSQAQSATRMQKPNRVRPGQPPSSALWARAASEIAGVAPSLIGSHLPISPKAAQGIVTVAPGETFDLGSVDADATGGFEKGAVKELLQAERVRIRTLQERLYAEHRRSVLVVFQAIDTGGKDGTIRSVFEGINPQGCRVWSFKVPSSEELDHDFLWRYHARTPGRGMIGVFNRSHYEDVLVVRVKKLVSEEVWQERYGLINDFERLLSLSGTTILKFFLHISKDEQKERLEARLADPEKHWKFDKADLVERRSWDSYQQAFSDALTRCSTPYAPWHVVPANRKWYRNLAIARTIADTLEAMDPHFPEADEGLAGLTVPD